MVVFCMIVLLSILGAGILAWSYGVRLTTFAKQRAERDLFDKRLKQDNETYVRNTTRLVDEQAAEIGQATAKAAEIVKRCTYVTFSRNGPRYAVNVAFEPRLMEAGPGFSEDYSMVAEMVASRVKYEIGSARFIHAAN